MPWFKVDDKLHDHRKTRKVFRGFKRKRRDVAPMGLWVVAGSWCADNLTDGFVPTDELDRWDDDAPALAARLVDAGFWRAGVDEHGEQGFWFHKWAEPGMQPTRAQVEAKREQARERMRRVRENHTTGSPRVRANTDETAQEVGSTPSRPVPTRPTLVTSSRHLSTVPAGFTDDDLTRIAAATGGDVHHAARVAADILARSPETPGRPLAYVLRSIGDEPGRYQPTPRPPRKDELCPQPGHSGRAGSCIQCASEAKAVQ